MHVLAEPLANRILTMLRSGEYSHREIARRVGVAKGTVDRYARAQIVGVGSDGRPVLGMPTGAARPTDVTIEEPTEGRRLCGCGCGEVVGPLASVRPGHQKSRETEERACAWCGEPFRIRTTAARLCCSRPRCTERPGWYRISRETYEQEHARRLAELRRRRRLATSVERDLIARMRARCPSRQGRSEETERELRRQDLVAASNPRERAAQTAAWLASATTEAERATFELLLKQQEADARRYRIKYQQSLDQTFADSDRHLFEAVWFDRDDDEDLYRSARSRRGVRSAQ